MAHALVFGGKVTQIEAESFPIHSDYTWVDISGLDPQPEYGWTYDGSSFAVPVLPTPSTGDIKREAMRRILGKYSDWKQRNMTTRGVELQDLWRQNGSWTSGQTSEDTALKAAWAWIDSVRAASDTLESSLPRDYQDDSHWPS